MGSTTSCASSFSNPSSDIWSRCQPKSKEAAQLELVLKASTCDVRVKENQSSDVKTEHVCIDLRHHNDNVNVPTLTTDVKSLQAQLRNNLPCKLVV